MTDPDIGFEPTPNQIAERTAAIRNSWPPAEFHKRVRTIPQLESLLPYERFTLGVECRHSELEDK